MKRILIGSVAVFALAACGGSEETTTTTAETPVAETSTPTSEAVDPMQAVLAGDWRSDAERARDEFRNPAETLAFFEVTPDSTVVEIFPGGGWYTNVLAPYLAKGDGTLIAAIFDEAAFEGDTLTRIQQRNADFKAKYAADPETFGELQYSAFSVQSGELAPPNSVDTVLTFRSIHGLMRGDYAPKLFEDAYAALKPGGVFGVVQHRLPSTAEQDPRAGSGYVHEDFVKAMAVSAGFEFVGASEINANPADTADHPFGVWTLPPVSRTSDREGNTPEGFDAAAYEAIGESDRMTLKFRKPLGE
ncbi:MAG: hypothetical protein AAFR74_05350 [Pseudomonadota bacterium]